jgi:hypothetical protein
MNTDEENERHLFELCGCGHTFGAHYLRGTWPACSECERCRRFQKPPSMFANAETVDNESKRRERDDEHR